MTLSKISKVCIGNVLLQPFRRLLQTPASVNFELNEQQKEIQHTARKFVREEVIPVASHYDQTREFPWDLVRNAHALGLMNCRAPKKFGGLELGQFEIGLISQELTYGCSSVETCIAVNNLMLAAFLPFASEELQKKYIPPLLTESIIVSTCVTEPGAGSDVAAIKTKAEKKGNEYILNGQKMFITNSGVATWYLVLARTSPDPKTPASKAFSAFIVEKEWPGVSLGKKERMLGERAVDNRPVFFEDVRIPKENLIGCEGSGLKTLLTGFGATRSMVAASGTGLAQRALDEAVKYSLQRKTFGTEIINHQGIAFALADMCIGVETAKLAWMKAALAYDKKDPDAELYLSIAKVYASEVANKCAGEAVMIFGACGVSAEYPAEKLFRDAKILQIYEGTTNIQKLIISRNLKKAAIKS